MFINTWIIYPQAWHILPIHTLYTHIDKLQSHYLNPHICFIFENLAYTHTHTHTYNITLHTIDQNHIITSDFLVTH
jgi:hypothetical protein